MPIGQLLLSALVAPTPAAPAAAPAIVAPAAPQPWYDRLSIRPTLSINARVCVDYPRVAQACKDAGWEFMGHSYEQGPIHKEADQPAMIARSMDTLE